MIIPDLLGDTEDAVSGDRTAQAQRDTTIMILPGTGKVYSVKMKLIGTRIGQDIMAEFQDFRQNVNQWVDRLSARVDDDTQRYD
jgi:hypothetical protein